MHPQGRAAKNRQVSTYPRPRGAQRGAPVPAVRTVVVSFEVIETALPATLSAIEEVRTLVGGRIESGHRAAFAHEHALTDAAIGLGVLSSTLRALTAEDPHYAG